MSVSIKVNYDKVMDEEQKELYKKFPPGHYLSDPDHVSRVMDWVTFWRRNLGRFSEYYLDIQLHIYQHVILMLMVVFPSICIIAARAAAKSFIIAVFSVDECVLYPGAQVVVASSTKGQANLIVTEKIEKELMMRSELLRLEILKIRSSNNCTEVIFKNGSSITVVVGNDNARGYRSTFLVYEEFRMIEKRVIDSVLSPFQVIRQAPFLHNPRYEHLQEEPKDAYISSSWNGDHWMWGLVDTHIKGMLDEKQYAFIAFDYSIAIVSGIKTRSYMIRERKKLDEISWKMEYENLRIDESAHAYFSSEMLHKNQKIKRAFYPKFASEFNGKEKQKRMLPKANGEVRVLSCDIASEGGAGNDNSVFSLIRLIPETSEHIVSDVSGNRSVCQAVYKRQVVYIETQNIFETTAQAIRIKQLFYDFEADHCVLDTRQAGIAIFDALAKVLYDEERNIEYRPWTCSNDSNVASRVVISGQEPVVYSIKASLELNSRIAVCMRSCLNEGKIELLVGAQDAPEELSKAFPGYDSGEVEVQLFYEKPYLETSALINEMVGLEYTVAEQTGFIKISEKGHARKDRYTSVSYGNYFADLLEQDLLEDNGDYEFLTLID